MKAIIATGKGSFDVIQEEEREKPSISNDEILVKIIAAGVNPVDYKVVLRGYFPTPLILGSDIAGIVEATEKNITAYKPGDAVIGSVEWEKQGAFAEYTATKPQYITHKPATVSFEEAAVIPLAALTAWQAVFDKLNIQPGEKLVVHAAAGGVGLFAVQFAKWKGAYVIGTASDRNKEFLLSLGVDEVVDYTKHPLNEIVYGADAVLDSISTPETQEQSYRSLKKGGRYVSIVDTGIPLDKTKLDQYGVSGTKFMFWSDAEQLKQIASLIEDRTVKIFIDKTFEMKDAREAIEYVYKGRTRGKVVLVNT